METTQPTKKPPVHRKQSSYYETLFRRPNAFKELLFNFFFNICSWPRLILEVFLRRDMGERYFSFSAVIFIFLLMVFSAMKIHTLSAIIYRSKMGGYMSMGLFIFALVFLYFGWQRRQEIKRLPSVYDFKRFSLSTGLTLPNFNKFSTDRRKLTTIYEPAAGFLAGLVFLVLMQLPVAFLLMGCSVIYSLSYFAAYHQGDNFLMDKIDEQICLQDLGRTFAENTPYDQTRGAEFFGRSPEDPEVRRRASSAFEAEDIAFEVV